MTKVAFTNCDIFTGSEVLSHHAVLVEDGRVLSIVDLESLSADVEVLDLDNSILAPGFIDLQVNGGGDVMFNDDPSAESLLRIGNAHRQFGTTDFLPTFITGEPSGMHAAAEACGRSLGMRRVVFLGYISKGLVSRSPWLACTIHRKFGRPIQMW